MMRILYYSPHPLLSIGSPAGYATHMKEMIRAFERLGHTVEPLIMGGTSTALTNTGVGRNGVLKEIAKKIIPSAFWETLKDRQLVRFDHYAAQQLKQTIERFKPDLIYERSNYLQVSGVKMARQMGVKHILEVNSPYVEERVVLGGKSYYLKLAAQKEKEQLRETDLIVVVSTSLRDYFIKLYKLSAGRFVVTPNAINAVEIRLSATPSVSRNDFGWSSNNYIFGFVGSIFRWHGVDLLIDAFTAISKNWPESKLLIIGDGEIMPELKSKAIRAKMDDKIVFTGSVPHDRVFDYIQMMDVAIMAKTNWYGSPIKLFEYGFLSKPVIAPNAGPVKDVLKDKETALLVDPEVHSIQQAMEWMLNNKAAATVMGNRFREQIMASHQWEHNAQAVLAAINNHA